MTYSSAEARQQLLDDLAEATDALGAALAALGAGYDLLDERSADRMEDELFGPVQKAYGRAQRTHADFAARYALPSRAFAQPSAGPASRDVRTFLQRAVEAVDEADERLVELQDSMMPVEVGDPELRAGLADVRELVADNRASAREFMRTLGR
ncbi:MAG TPA: hypothetical protein VFG79_06715 [Solirubrobacter sp.]|nr:hypothetical protein [Solirubrobacter sp.]